MATTSTGLSAERRVVMTEEIKLIKRSKVERLAIANTLIDSVIQETDNSILLKELNGCMKTLSDCIDLIAE